MTTLGSSQDRRHDFLWAGVLLIATAASSLVSACAVPIAAFAVAAAAAFGRRNALLVVAAIWFLNQAIGFGVLGYPLDLETLLWGPAMLAAALAATAVATASLFWFAPRRIVALPVTFIAAFAAYEACLYLAALRLGGVEDFAAAIMVPIIVANVLWLAGLTVAYEASRLLLAKWQGESAGRRGAEPSIAT
jgi:hypothetical protein